jgi:hypothetical protein
VFLHEQLGLEVQLRKFQAYRTAQETLVTVSQLYPPPDVEEFVLSPEISEQAGKPSVLAAVIGRARWAWPGQRTSRRVNGYR